jgi:hypothetical protein
LSLLTGIETKRLELHGTETESLLRGFPRGLEVLELREPVPTMDLRGIPVLNGLIRTAKLKKIVITGGRIEERVHEWCFWKGVPIVV